MSPADMRQEEAKLLLTLSFLPLNPAMPLRFNQRSPKPARTTIGGIPMRLISLAMGLGLVVMLMQVAQSPGTREKLAVLFGDAPPVVEMPEGEALAQVAMLPTIDQALLDSVEDNTTFRDEETDAWFHLITTVRDTSDAHLSAASVGEIVYAQLLGQPTFYRGRVIKVDGNARRVEKVKPSENDHGIEELFLVYVQPSRDVVRPFAFYCLELPPGWSADGEIPNDGLVTCQALFFKNRVINNQLGIDLMPVFVARSMVPVAAEPSLVDRTPSMPAWQMVAIAAAVAAAMVALIAMRNNEQPRRRFPADAVEVGKLLQTANQGGGDES